MASLTLSMLEIIVLMVGAIVLGITIHFFITSRKQLKNSSIVTDKTSKNLEEWKLKYFNEVETRDKEIADLRQRLNEAEENSSIYSIEAAEMRRQNKLLQSEMENNQKPSIQGEKPDYIEQLRQAQDNLMQHNDKINQLLEHIEVVKETEEKQQEIMRNNEELSGQIASLKFLLSQKEKEVVSIREKADLTKEMSSMLDNAYSEFGALQSKIQKLESQVSSSRMVNLDYEDLKESHYKQGKDLEEYKTKLNAASALNQQLLSQLTETEDKLFDATFARQQLQKRVSYLEELSGEMQAVTDANKKLENQLRRVGELESKLNMLSEERDELVRRHLGE